MKSIAPLIALILTAILLIVPGTARPAFPGSNGKIAFATNRDGNYEIYTMNPDGTGQTRLTNTADDEFFPVWPADGSKIAYERDTPAAQQIYSMSATGGNQIRLSDGASADEEPGWAPDGTKLVFTSNRNGAAGLEVWRMNANGTGYFQITNTGGFNVDPVWSPDGTKIAFMSDRDGNWEIYLVNPDGSSPTRITNNTANDYGPSWSPDGSKLAFASTRDGNAEIYSMDANGTNQTRLTNDPGEDSSPSWSADGTKIFFNSDRDGDREVFAMNVDGTAQTPLTNNSAQDRHPDPQPLGSGGGGDTTAPILHLPANVTVDATSAAGAAVFYTATATDDTDASPTVTCAPPSGSTFAIGTTTVNCTAADNSGNSSNGSFTITVRSAADQLGALISEVVGAAVLPPGLQALIARFDPRNAFQRQAVCSGLRIFVQTVQAQAGRRIPPATAARWIADANRIRAVLGC
jgi:TolB protein